MALSSNYVLATTTDWITLQTSWSKGHDFYHAWWNIVAHVFENANWGIDDGKTKAPTTIFIKGFLKSWSLLRIGNCWQRSSKSLDLSGHSKLVEKSFFLGVLSNVIERQENE